MAKTNQIIENPVIGDKIRFLTTSEDSKGEVLKIELHLKGGAKGNPNHFHPVQSETFEIISGTLGVYRNGKETLLAAGQQYVVAPNEVHRFWNPTQEEVVFTVEFKPALKTEYFLETIYALAQQGKVNKDSLPAPLQFFAILNEYYGEIFVESPPIPIQKFMAKVVGGFAKFIGYKGYITFPENK
jgi:mannose-6-phosphate isomerase-like protein (cupin superfamily)